MGSPGTERPPERCPRSLSHRDRGRLGPSCPFRLLDSLRYAYLLLTVLRNDRLIPHKRKVISLGALYYRVLCLPDEPSEFIPATTSRSGAPVFLRSGFDSPTVSQRQMKRAWLPYQVGSEKCACSFLTLGLLPRILRTP